MQNFTNCVPSGLYKVHFYFEFSLIWCTATRPALRWFANTFSSPLVHTHIYFLCPSLAPGWSPAMLSSHPSENDGYIMHPEQRQGQSCRCCAERASPGPPGGAWRGSERPRLELFPWLSMQSIRHSGHDALLTSKVLIKHSDLRFITPSLFLSLCTLLQPTESANS